MVRNRYHGRKHHHVSVTMMTLIIMNPSSNSLSFLVVVKVHELPEGWKLPSILSASTQIAQIGPILFLVGKRFAPNTFTYERAIYTILFIGATSCFLLSFFWNAKATLFGIEVSLGLYILNFSLAILGKHTFFAQYDII